LACVVVNQDRFPIGYAMPCQAMDAMRFWAGDLPAVKSLTVM